MRTPIKFMPGRADFAAGGAFDAAAPLRRDACKAEDAAPCSGSPFPLVWRLLVAAFFLLLVSTGNCAEVIPAEPTRYFNDFALAVKPETADRLNTALEDFEKETSNQILVAIFPKLQTDSSLEDYCNRVFRGWNVGQKERHNGAVLFVFIQDHKMRIEVDRGLEGVLTDATCKDIISDRIAPKFKAGDFDGGLTDGVNAMIAAAKNEYKGTGKTVYQQQNGTSRSGHTGSTGGGSIFFIILVFIIISILSRRRRGGVFTGGGYSSVGPFFGGFGGGFGGGGGGFGGGGFGGGGGGSFSGGGGSSDSGGAGGGGASGDW